MLTPNSELEFIIIGGGLQGLSAGLALRKRGHKVIILEMKAAAGQVVSRRSTLMPHGGGHSSYLFFDTEALRTLYCYAMNLAVHDPSRLNSRALEIYLSNSHPVGKKVIAWTPEGCATIERLMQLGKGSPVENIVEAKTYFGSDIAALNEPFFEKRLPQGVLHLPHVKIFRLPSIIDQMAAAFEYLGGTILYNHEVTGFAAGSSGYSGTKGTAVICNVNGDTKVLHANAAINMAGMHAGHVAELSRRPVREFADSHAGGDFYVESLIPDDPHFHYYGMWQAGPGTPEAKIRAKSLIYSADLIPANGEKLGLHAYLAQNMGDGTWSNTYGTWRRMMTSREALARATPNDLEKMNSDFISDLHGLMPWGVDPAHLVQVEAGRVAVYYHEGRRDFFTSVGAIPAANYIVLDPITGDTPGGFCASIIGENIAEFAVIGVTQGPAAANHRMRHPMLALQ